MGVYQQYKHHSKQAKKTHKTAASRSGHHLLAMGYRLLATAPFIKAGKNDTGHDAKVDEHYGKSWE